VKILHVVPSYIPALRYGGTIVSVHGLCRALVKRGHDVHVFTTNVDGDADAAVPIDSPVIIDGVTVRYFRSPMLRRLYWAPGMRSALNRDVSGFSIVHTHSVFLWPTWAAATAARIHNVPYLLAPRGMLVPDLVRRKSSFAKKLWIAMIERRNLERASGVHVTSDLEAAELKKFGFMLPAVYMVPNGVDPVASEQAPEPILPPSIEAVFRPGHRVVLYVGRISWKKGLDRLIATLSEVPDVTLLIVGNDENGYTSELVALAKAHGVDRRVVFGGAMYGDVKAALYRRATVLVLPSYSENFGNVVLEAMATGCAVIVTPEVGAASIVAASGGGIVVAGDRPALAAALRKVVESAELQREMGSRGREWVATRYSWDCVAAAMDGAYSDAIVRHGTVKPGDMEIR
jgi:glycosyltransferase involved in cell wall biosynthesis